MVAAGTIIHAVRPAQRWRGSRPCRWNWDCGASTTSPLKRDRTPREATAQALDYSSWAQTLAHEDVLDLFGQYRPGETFEQAFADRFGVAPPEEINTAHRLTIVASDLDPVTERIIAYLAGYQVPINVALFRYFKDGDRAYLAHTWLLPDTDALWPWVWSPARPSRSMMRCSRWTASRA